MITGDIPGFMELDSRGPLVVLLQVMLHGARMDAQGMLVADGVYGEVTTICVRSFQASLDVEADGAFGPTTRRALRERRGLDFDRVARLIPGTTFFVQPDGQ